MSAKAGNMAAPEDVGTIATIVGGIAAGGWGLMKMFQQYSGIKADVANSNSEIQMLKEYQGENKELRARIDAKDIQIATLMQEKFTYQADLKSALEKIQYMTVQIEELRQELASIKDAVKGSS